MSLPFGLRPDELWVIATATCCASACGILGCFLVLRRLSLLGDAISHAVLPGLVLAFIVTNSRDILPMLVGAGIVGVLTAVLSAGLNRWGRVPEDAALGVVFTSLFALGVVLLAFIPRDVDLDPKCVLYGMIEYTTLDTVRFLGLEAPRAFVWLLITLLVDATLIAVFFKELKIVAFDPYLATTMGINAGVVHLSLLAAVAGTTVASFESVGSILVVAMLIAPGATAHLLTDRLSRMLWIAAAVSVVSAVAGYLLAWHWNTEVAGMMSVVAGAQFALAAFLAPRHGVVSKLVHRAGLAQRIRREDVLGLLYRWQESRRAVTESMQAAEVAAAVGGGLWSRAAVASLRRGGRIVRGAGGGLELTEAGLAEARRIIRSHRLWETYLSQRLGLPPDHLHEPSHRVEHFITASLAAELDRELPDQCDPHGREIPRGAAEHPKREGAR
jgi:manganese/zinc/iron transport system permease protein